MAKRPQGRQAQKPKAKLDRAEDQARVLGLVRQGFNFREIARQLECSVGTAHKLYVDGRNALPAAVAAQIAADVVEREMAIIRTHWKRRGESENAKVIQAAHKNILATLPTRTELSGVKGGPIVSLDLTSLSDEQLVRIAAGLSPDAPGEGGTGAPPSSSSQN